MPYPASQERIERTERRRFTGESPTGFGSIDDVVTAIRALPLKHSTLKALIVATEVYANESKAVANTDDVCAHLQDALGAADEVYAWRAE